MPHNGLYSAIGGTPGCRQLAEALYARIARDPLLRPLFPGKTFTCAIEEFTAFLVQLLGGPSEDSQRRWWLSIHESHLRFQIGMEQRAAWLKSMAGALDDAPLDESTRAALRDFFQHASAYLVNHGAAAHTPEDPREPHLAERWNVQRGLDDTVAALRAGDAERSILLARDLPLGVSERAGLLMLMLGFHDDALRDYVHHELLRDPSLLNARYNGRTLLHAAAAAGCLPTLELLLSKGADPNTLDGGSHTPLYSVANECTRPDAGKIVRALVQAGARANACDGVKRTTALHMAARRGSVEIAGALLDCGADIEARDSLGETPLRRAVNCNKPEVAALLVSRGANVRSRGSKGLTPLEAARTEAMRGALHVSRA